MRLYEYEGEQVDPRSVCGGLGTHLHTCEEIAALKAKLAEARAETRDKYSDREAVAWRERAERAEDRLAKAVEALHEIEYMPCLPSEPTAILLRKMAGAAALASAQDASPEEGK
jgi:hypothetical protein